MLNNAIEKNKRFLRFCSHVAQFSGALLLLLGLISIALTVWDYYMPGYGMGIVTVISRYTFRLIFPSLFLLGINQFIKSLIDSNFKPNWILKFSDKIIYLYVALLIINFIFFTIYQTETTVASSHFYLTTWIPSAIFASVKALLWIAMAQVLRRIVPMIEESKTLV